MTPTPQQPDVRELAARTVSKVRGDSWRQDFVITDEDIADAVLAAVTPVIRRQVAEELRAVAAGRREYAAADGLARPVEISDVPLLIEAEVVTLETAARIAEGDKEPLYSLLPSWRWTDEMHDAVSAAIARSHSAQPTEEETTNG